MGPRSLLLITVLLLAAGANAKSAITHVRGVRPELAGKYEPATDPKTGRKVFSCLNGEKTIPYDGVNDDWCDCSDGSDEPGTSACGNGVFYCRNRGHEPMAISTAFVDDGICDCCDGSDELEGCTNTCIEKNAAVRQELKKKVDDYRKGLERRKDYAASAALKREAMKERLGGIDGEIKEAEADVEKANAKKAELEASADERKAARLEKRRQEAEAAAEQRRKEAEEVAAAKAKEEAEAKAKDAEAAGAKGGGGEAGAQAGGEAGDSEESAEERGRRIAAQWTSDPEAAGAAAEEKDAAVADGDAADTVTGDASEYGGDTDWDKLATDSHEGEDPHAEGAEPAEEEDVDLELQGANAMVTSAEERVAALEEEKELLKRQVTYDYGPDGAWVELSDRCTDVREPHFLYRMCLFNKATQTDNHGGHETSLGKWKGFEKDYTEGVFDGGDWCVGAPARSLRVSFHCGVQERGFDASEPSTCVYTANMATPAACRESALKELEDQLAKLIAEQEALAKEVEAEEAERRAAFKARAAEVQQQAEAQQQGKDEL